MDAQSFSGVSSDPASGTASFLTPYQSVRVTPCETPLAEAIASLTVTREVCPPRSEYVNAPLSALALFLTEQGEAEIDAGGQTLCHRPGSLVVVNAGVPLRERVRPSAAWKVGYLLLTGAWADALGSVLEERGQGSAMYQPAPPHWQRQFRDLLELGFVQGSGWRWPFLSGCATLFGWIERYPPSKEGTGLEGAGSLLDEVERLLDQDRRRVWTVEELAAAANLTARQFSYRFGKASGRSPALWLRERRIADARRLLHAGKSVSKTAEALGFANPYHFSRMFKSVTGVPPSTLRAQPGSTLHTSPRHPPRP